MIYSEILNKVREMRQGDAVVDVLVHLVSSLQEENDLVKQENKALRKAISNLSNSLSF
ncbi:hypothetical protein PQC48_gp112 [Escherichia phage MN05]|uniref:Uncharacterized protein n=1 Tax=Escherichia phage MN05 TaxID=2711185 RepID=A0A858I0V6_9CAUD|nr:hypothetical protein PQC48_gp112 [Escherichia phage MN05]QIN96178.1 hypothetical protein MN05_00114 [Escherichia phage MN05]